MSEHDPFRIEHVEAMTHDTEVQNHSRGLFNSSFKHKYPYNFKWMGRPIIQYPQDMVALQELIWQIKPDLIIETGIAHGGSIVFFASMLELLGGDGQVLGIDIDIRAHNRLEIENHSMFKRISMLEGSSIDAGLVAQVETLAKDKKSVMVILDSHHTHDHVMAELQAYSPLVTKGSYLVVLDTVVEDLPEDMFPDRPWKHGDNPKTAVWEFLESNNRFVIDPVIPQKLLMTSAPDGYLKCIAD
jgi:cephalosporin hydroxylase